MKLPAFHIQPLPHFSAKRGFTAGEVPGGSKGVATLHNLLSKKNVAKHKTYLILSPQPREIHTEASVSSVCLFIFMF